MKVLRAILIVIAATLLIICLMNMAEAQTFHSGGVAYCEGCHTMHNSLGGNPVAVRTVTTSGTTSQIASGKPGNSVAFQGENYLLQGSDQSSTCLNCHAGATLSSYHVMTFPEPSTGGTAPVNRNPGGDFGWLYRNYPVAGYAPASPGTAHGHNINAFDYNLPSGAVPTTAAPGGTYSSSNLYCTSCHDPHSNARMTDANGTIAYNTLGSPTLPITGSGSYGVTSSGTPPAVTTTFAIGVYRLLGGVGYVPMSYSGGPSFKNPPPVAVAPSKYNQTEATHEVRVAYGYGMSEWCANCHTQIHNNNTGSSNTALIHPAGNGAALSAKANISGQNTTIVAIYNAYKMSGDLSGNQGTSYTSMVPYEEGIGTTLTTLTSHASNTGAYTVGPSGSENVMCLSCHRAHASGFNQGTRWNNNAEFLTVAGVWPDASTSASQNYSNGMPQADYQAAMYDRLASNYATYQRSLCNKCHGKD